MTDAAGYVVQTSRRDPPHERKDGVACVSWISNPGYLPHAHDTLDTIDRGQLVPVTETVTEIVKSFMALDGTQ